MGRARSASTLDFGSFSGPVSLGTYAGEPTIAPRKIVLTQSRSLKT